MRLTRMVGLAAVAVVAVMALTGSDSALATALCSNDPEGAKCNTGTELSGLLNIDALQILGVASFLTSLGSVSCQSGHIKAHIPNASLSEFALQGRFTEFSYLECEAFWFGCNKKPATVETKFEPEFELSYTEPRLGSLTILFPITEIRIQCGGIVGTVTCFFSGQAKVVGTVHDLHEFKKIPYLKFNKAPVSGPGGGLCPKSGELDSAYALNYLDATKFPAEEAPVFIAR